MFFSDGEKKGIGFYAWCLSLLLCSQRGMAESDRKGDDMDTSEQEDIDPCAAT